MKRGALIFFLACVLEVAVSGANTQAGGCSRWWWWCSRNNSRCTHNNPHFNLELVKENKTWEAAMEHCRLHNSDLVSLTSLYMLNYTLNTSETAQTDHVWTGLRYLADTWLWLNGRRVHRLTWSQGEPPQCPAEGHRCGALSLRESQCMESWDCADKLNFVCFSKT